MSEQVKAVETEQGISFARNPVTLMLEMATDGLVYLDRGVHELDRGIFPGDLSRILYWSCVSDGGRLALIPDDIDPDLNLETEINETFDDSLYEQIESGVYVKKVVGEFPRNGFRIIRDRRLGVLNAGHSHLQHPGKQISTIHQDRPSFPAEVGMIYERLSRKSGELTEAVMLDDARLGLLEVERLNLFRPGELLEFVERLVSYELEITEDILDEVEFRRALLASVMRNSVGIPFTARQVAEGMVDDMAIDRVDGRITAPLLNSEGKPLCVEEDDQKGRPRRSKIYKRTFGKGANDFKGKCLNAEHPCPLASLCPELADYQDETEAKEMLIKVFKRVQEWLNLNRIIWVIG